MSVFSAKDFHQHEKIAYGFDARSGLKCIVAIHNTKRGPALGGCRMWNYGNEEEALTDVLRLSKCMSYKAALADLPLGGGKAVIIGDPQTDKSEELLMAFGRFVHSLGGAYRTAVDVGTTVEDMDIVRRETRFAHCYSGGSGDPSFATSLGVFTAIRAAVKHRLGREDLSHLRVAVQGLGNVGRHLCEHLSKAGAKLVVTDIRDQTVMNVAKDFDVSVVEPDAIYNVQADVFAPCALGAVIKDETLGRLNVNIVAGAANNQLAEARHGDELRRLKILYAPDYVANAGGLINVANEKPGYQWNQVEAKVLRIQETLKQIFARADKENCATSIVADRMAEEILAESGHSTDMAA